MEEKHYFRLRPKETPNVLGFVLVSNGGKLESIMSNDYTIEPISEKEALIYKEWKIGEDYYCPKIPTKLFRDIE